MIKHIYVGPVPDEEITQIPSNITEITNPKMYFVKQISGVSRPDADIPISALAGANASRLSSAQIKSRNIVMDIALIRHSEYDRIKLYEILPFDKFVRLYIKTDTRFVFIDGKAEKIDGDDEARKLFNPQVSIICPFPWLQSVKLYKKNLLIGDNEIDYNGDIPAGFTLDVPRQINPPLLGSVSDLSVTIGTKTFAYSGRVSTPYICTIPGRKQFEGIRKAESGGTVSNLAPAFGAMTPDCQWPTISKGDKIVTVSCLDTDKEWFERQNIFTYRDTYSGV